MRSPVEADAIYGDLALVTEAWDGGYGIVHWPSGYHVLCTDGTAQMDEVLFVARELAPLFDTMPCRELPIPNSRDYKKWVKSVKPIVDYYRGQLNKVSAP